MTIEIGQRIRERRKELGMSAEDIAALIGVSPATIYRYESSDIKHMRLDKLVPIAMALSTTTDYLMGIDNKVSVEKLKMLEAHLNNTGSSGDYVHWINQLFDTAKTVKRPDLSDLYLKIGQIMGTSMMTSNKTLEKFKNENAFDLLDFTYICNSLKSSLSECYKMLNYFYRNLLRAYLALAKASDNAKYFVLIESLLEDMSMRLDSSLPPYYLYDFRDISGKIVEMHDYCEKNNQ